MLKESFILFLKKDIFESWINESHLQQETKDLYIEQYGNIKRDMTILLGLDFEEEEEKQDSSSTYVKIESGMDEEFVHTGSEMQEEKKSRSPSPRTEYERILQTVDNFFSFGTENSPRPDSPISFNPYWSNYQ